MAIGLTLPLYKGNTRNVLPFFYLKIMAEQRQRDERGRFVKGVTIGNRCTKDTAKEAGRNGGLTFGRNSERRRLLKEELRDILDEETTKGSGITKMQAVIQNVLKNTLSHGRAKDLKIIAEVLGEMEINVNLNQTEKPRIVFDDDE